MPNDSASVSSNTSLSDLSVNTIRFLAADAVQKANSGHPGMPMGAAPMAYAAWHRHLRVDPSSPDWANRDRFILSAGHGSMLLYALLHLSGFDLTLEDLMQFRQWGSRTPGHPENFHTKGVETTTGPLGQGFANGVGMAMAEAFLAARFNRPGFEVVDHHTIAIVSDGDMMEGISHEAASLAGHYGLGKLIYLYDDNGITIDGSTDLAYTEDATGRFESYGWQVLDVEDGNDVQAIDAAIREAKGETERPTLIRVRTIIGYGSPNKEGTASSHGSPLGDDEIALTRERLGWTASASFHIPGDVATHMAEIAERGRKERENWDALMLRYAEAYPEESAALSSWMAGELPSDVTSLMPSFEEGSKVATRGANGTVLAALDSPMPNLVGGSADLSGSNKTEIKGRKGFQRDTPDGSYFFFGVREHAMASICNGMQLHGGLRTYCGTFLVFSDYMRPAIRLSALMEQPVIYVLTHDSIGLGEDGPTHQPIEHFMALRAIPNCTFIRPADGPETAGAWVAALENTTGPTLLALSRQGLPTLNPDTDKTVANVSRGAYIVRDTDGQPDAIIMATGSEVAVAMEAAGVLHDEGVQVRVVSMPSWELFAKQDASYREAVLPHAVTSRVSVEAGITMGWERWIGAAGSSVGIDHFGASAPAEELFARFGFTSENVAAHVRKVLGS